MLIGNKLIYIHSKSDIAFCDIINTAIFLEWTKLIVVFYFNIILQCKKIFSVEESINWLESHKSKGENGNNRQSLPLWVSCQLMSCSFFIQNPQISYTIFSLNQYMPKLFLLIHFREIILYLDELTHWFHLIKSKILWLTFNSTIFSKLINKKQLLISRPFNSN